MMNDKRTSVTIHNGLMGKVHELFYVSRNENAMGIHINRLIDFVNGHVKISEKDKIEINYELNRVWGNIEEIFRD